MSPSNQLGLPALGVGLTVGAHRFADLLAHRPGVDWIEVVPEHVMESRGRTARALEEIAERYPIALHALSLSMGSTDPLDQDYLDELALLARRLSPRWVSDHLSWSCVGGMHSHTLLPLPYDEATLAHVSERVRRVQEALACRLLVENAPAYLTFDASTMPEHEFLARLAEAADCGLLIDLGNLRLSQQSGAIEASAAEYLEALPAGRIVEIHLSAYVELETHAIPARDAPLADETWELLAHARRCFGVGSVAIDRAQTDLHLDALLGEVATARAILARSPSPVGADHGA